METYKDKVPSDKENDRIVKCNRCRNIHTFGERLSKPNHKRGGSDIVCPRCLSKVHIKP